MLLQFQGQKEDHLISKQQQVLQLLNWIHLLPVLLLQPQVKET